MSIETGAAGFNSGEFVLAGKPPGDEQSCEEHGNRDHQPDNVWDGSEIILDHDTGRCLCVYEIVQFLHHIDNDKNEDEREQSEKE